MFSCPICGAVNLPSLSMLLSHIRVIHSSEPGFSIQCNLQGCRRTFKNFSTFRNHTYSFHDQATGTNQETAASVYANQETAGFVDGIVGTDSEEENEMEHSTPPSVIT